MRCFNRAFGMRHHAQHIAAWVGDAGNIEHGAVRIGGIFLVCRGAAAGTNTLTFGNDFGSPSTTYNGLPMANLTGVVNNNVDGANLTLSGTALLAGRNAGSEAIIGTVSNAPPRPNATTGLPLASASTAVMPKSSSPGSRNARQCAYNPRNSASSTRSPSPRWARWTSAPSPEMRHPGCDG